MAYSVKSKAVSPLRSATALHKGGGQKCETQLSLMRHSPMERVFSGEYPPFLELAEPAR
jgi:hypothetical protein